MTKDSPNFVQEHDTDHKLNGHKRLLVLADRNPGFELISERHMHELPRQNINIILPLHRRNDVVRVLRQIDGICDCLKIAYMPLVVAIAGLLDEQFLLDEELSHLRVECVGL